MRDARIFWGGVLLFCLACFVMSCIAWQAAGAASPCTPDSQYSPTPTLKWSAVIPQPGGQPIAGYDLYERDPGGIWHHIARFPLTAYQDSPISQWWYWQRGVDMDIPVQRYCPLCAPDTLHDFSVRAYDTLGNSAINPGNIVSVCFSPICVAPGPCS